MLEDTDSLLECTLLIRKKYRVTTIKIRENSNLALESEHISHVLPLNQKIACSSNAVRVLIILNVSSKFDARIEFFIH